MKLPIFATFCLLSCFTVEAANIRANPLWKHYKLVYVEEFQMKWNHIDSLLFSRSFDVVLNVIKDSAYTKCFTNVELFLIRTIAAGASVLNDKRQKDSLFIGAVNVVTKKNKNSYSPYDRLIYGRAYKDSLIVHLYDRFHTHIDSLHTNNQIDSESYLFYKAVFPADSISYDSLMNIYEKIVRADINSENSKLIYKYCYNRGKWNGWGILFGMGLSNHWFGGEGASYFDPNLAFNMLNIDIYLNKIAIKGGINFTGHGNLKELQFQNYSIPADASLNFTELFLVGGYCFSLKDRVLLTPYFGISNVFNNFSVEETEKFGVDPSFPNIHSIKYGVSSMFSFASREAIQSIVRPGDFYITADFSVENYDMRHLGIPHSTPKFFAMVGWGALFGKKVKNKIF